MSQIDEGDDVLLYLDGKRTYLVRIEKNTQFHTHKGYVELDELIGKPYGSPLISSLGVRFNALKPLVRDRILKTDRRTQVLYPKDIGYILIHLGIGPGNRIVEAGTGSGALTMSLANAVKPNGIVYSYEINPEFQIVATRNIERSGLKDYVKLQQGDITMGINEEDVDAVVLDMAVPWLVVPCAFNALTGSGVFVSFSPTIEQVMKTTTALHQYPFVEIETIELMLRKITVSKNKTRPQTRMLGHSGYITSARKIIE
jgi:tRNA (adenine57-N1/adenine58-N1)-methyltransferase